MDVKDVPVDVLAPLFVLTSLTLHVAAHLPLYTTGSPPTTHTHTHTRTHTHIHTYTHTHPFMTAQFLPLERIEISNSRMMQAKIGLQTIPC